MNPYECYMTEKRAGILGKIVEKATTAPSAKYMKAVATAAATAPDSKLLKGLNMAAQVPSLANKAIASTKTLSAVKATEGTGAMLKKLPGEAADYVGHLNKAINNVRKAPRGVTPEV